MQVYSQHTIAFQMCSLRQSVLKEVLADIIWSVTMGQLPFLPTSLQITYL